MKQKRNKGQSLVEVSLLLPVLLMLLLGVIDFGRAYYILVALTSAADEGAFYASLKPLDEAGIVARTVESAANSIVEIDPADVAIVTAGSLAPGAPITVTVAFPMDLFTPLIGEFIQAEDNVEGNVLVLHGSSSHPIFGP